MKKNKCKQDMAISQVYYPVQITRLEDIICDHEELSSLPCIVVVSEGVALCPVNDKEFKLSRGSVLLLDNAKSFLITVESKLRGIVIQYRTYGHEKPSILHHAKPLLNCSYRIINLALELQKASRNTSIGNPFHFQRMFVELLEALYNELDNRKKHDDLWIEKVLDYIDLYFHEELTRDQVAEIAQVSPEHFSRTFHKHTGYTFSAYLTLLRIRKSQQRLLQHMPKLDLLAQEVGYSEGTYFSRKFKQLVGVSPTAYYKKEKRIVALNTNHTACLIALGITPELGVYSPWLESVRQVSPVHKLKGYEHDIASNYQEITAACPDVIINYSGSMEKQFLLSLAPVFELPCRQLSWREQFGLIANIVDRREVYKSWLQQYDEQIALCNHILDQQHGTRGTAIVWEIGSHAAYCLNSSHGRGSHILYEDLGFSRPDAIITQNIEQTGYLTVDIEEIVHFPADYIFITALPTKDFGKERLLTVLHSEKWQSLMAVQKKQVYFINQYELFYGYDPLSTASQLHKLMGVLTSQKYRATNHFHT
ncbi:ABC transporter substrate-binding protein [Lysinibacillus sp. NPDC086135]|uniref:ABC transporter substrate-binding protein n=1 Tax=Lysinibacillus sp. NPDC086135 TaxID=3364130 RepID=UPI0038199A24